MKTKKIEPIKPIELIVHTRYIPPHVAVPEPTPSDDEDYDIGIGFHKDEKITLLARTPPYYRATFVGLGYQETRTIAIGVSICSPYPDSGTGKIDNFSRKKGRQDAHKMAEEYPLLLERVIIEEGSTAIRFRAACLVKLLAIAKDMEGNIARYKELSYEAKKRQGTTLTFTDTISSRDGIQHMDNN